jgi:tRNA-splicing ligase RtcB (3'-phosphate/5'-hydroxy nucleic acid ligase)
MSNYTYERATNGATIKHWTNGVPLEERAREQLLTMASMPFIHKHVAAMPDVHYGNQATVGSVIATKGAVIPAIVGCDIGCGMCAIKLSLKAHQLPDNLKEIRLKIESMIPHGRAKFGMGSWRAEDTHQARWGKMSAAYKAITDKHPQVKAHGALNDLGTLGGGNHFIEVCLDEFDSVWVMIHSGSRSVGGGIGNFFIEKAKREMERYHIMEHLPNKDMSYLVEHTEIFDDYLTSMKFAQNYAAENRAAMLDNTLLALRQFLPAFTVEEEAINCHHNYIDIENHYAKNVFVTRKGAVRARKGDLGIIPGSMGTGSFIVRGLGNKESFCSCSHGAGRLMSRKAAKASITPADHKAAMVGIEARLDEGVLDESPSAYKNIDAVMAAQDDLVEVLYRLRQVINIKG